MLQVLSKYFEKYHIDTFAPLPLSLCHIQKKYLLDKEGIENGTAILYLIPYYTKACDQEDRNISTYATGKDYHYFVKQMYQDILPMLQKDFPTEKFVGFVDHSPIDERLAAVNAGLGVFGDNGMLLTKKYSSYIFLGEIITTMELPYSFHEVSGCLHCGACQKTCPREKIGTCLSALTQKKGQLTDDEKKTILEYGSLWGCDICAEVCPYTKEAKANGTLYSPIPFFQENATPHLTKELVESMSEEEFSTYAYAWRGKETILRNLNLK